MSGTETIIPEDVTALAADLQAEVGPLLDQAATHLAATDVSGGSFSNAGLAMQVVYPGLYQWAIQDAQTTAGELDSICDRLAATARLWSGAEAGSTVTIEV
jgi:hypothetical protein